MILLFKVVSSRHLSPLDLTVPSLIGVMYRRVLQRGLDYYLNRYFPVRTYFFPHPTCEIPFVTLLDLEHFLNQVHQSAFPIRFSSEDSQRLKLARWAVYQVNESRKLWIAQKDRRWAFSVLNGEAFSAALLRFKRIMWIKKETLNRCLLRPLSRVVSESDSSGAADSPLSGYYTPPTCEAHVRLIGRPG